MARDDRDNVIGFKTMALNSLSWCLLGLVNFEAFFRLSQAGLKNHTCIPNAVQISQILHWVQGKTSNNPIIYFVLFFALRCRGTVLKSGLKTLLSVISRK
jgi:hypothetical protein